MATLPTFPSFATQETPTLAKMQQLGYAVQFVTQVPIVISLKRNATQSVAANTATAVQWNVSEVDSDSMHSNVTNPSRLTVVTQGYYTLHACVSLNQVASVEYQAYFQQTTSTNNPLGSGHTQVFGADASESGTSTGDFMSIDIAGMTPCLYVGDYVEAYVLCASSCTIQNAYNASGHNDQYGFADGGSCLYGYYLTEGP